MNKPIMPYKSWMLPLMLLLSLGFRIEHRVVYRNFYLDTEVQLAAAQSWLNDTGFGYRYAEGPDLAEIHYRSAHIFMPGYVATVIPVFLLIEDWFDAALLIDVLSLLMMYIGLFWTWRELNGDHWHLLWLLLLLGFSPAPMQYLMASGLLAIGLFSLGLAALITALKKQKLPFFVLSCFFLSLSAGTRSAYLPLIFSATFGRWIYGLFRRKAAFRWWGIIGCVVAIGSVLLMQQLKAGDESFFDQMSEKWYPEHLLEIEPFFFKTFFYYGVPHELWLEHKSPIAAFLLNNIALLITAGFVILGLWVTVRLLKEKRAASEPFLILLIIFWITLAINVGMLILMSLKIPPESWNWQGFWTFVMEPRYYMPTMWGILIFCFFYVGQSGSYWSKRGLKVFLLFATVASLTYPIYLKGRVHLFGEQSDTFLADPRPKWVEEMQKQVSLSQEPVIATSSTNSHLGEMVGANHLAMGIFSSGFYLFFCTSASWGLTKSEDIPPQASKVMQVEEYWWWEIIYLSQ